jgi:hypothetical protein
MTHLRRQLDDQRTDAGRLQLQLRQAQNRFAGIDLLGRRVILLVDMSGSMGSLDNERLDPNKWPAVGRTIAQLLRSLSQVEQYQVILFSDRTQFLLGRPGEWLAYDLERTPGEVQNALANVKPSGDTNMYAAFEAAFRYRSQGLDTIYLFSDGLPNIGPGLPASPPRDEGAQSALLGKYLLDTLARQWNRDTPKVRIHAVGFFYESPNLGAFLWSLTRENGGNFVGMNLPNE